MIRQHLVDKGPPADAKFRWRGHSVSRLENLMDVAFALALGAIVISAEPPRTFAELSFAFKQLPAFAASFAIIVMLWFFHYWHHRRYGLEDTVSTLLNFALLFLILGYAFPLRFLFTALFGAMFTGRFGVVPTADGGTLRVLQSAAEVQTATALYAGGFAAIFLVLTLLTVQAYRKREQLELDDRERLMTREAIEGHGFTAAFATTLTGLSLASVTGAAIAGPAFGLLGPMHWAHGRFCTRRRAALEARLRVGPDAPPGQ